jgi:dehydrogenase/reductase SDR family protein 12
VWLVATRPPSTPHHFWHDRAPSAPTTVCWQRADDEERVGRFLGDVTTSTGTSAF